MKGDLEVKESMLHMFKVVKQVMFDKSEIKLKLKYMKKDKDI